MADAPVDLEECLSQVEIALLRQELDEVKADRESWKRLQVHLMAEKKRLEGENMALRGLVDMLQAELMAQ